MCRQPKQLVHLVVWDLGKDSDEHHGQGTELLKILNTAAYEAA